MKRILLIVALGLTFLSNAQKGGLKGVVLDENKQPLPGASVMIVKTKTGTATDFDGNYALLSIVNGTYKVLVSFIGYETLESTITIHNKITKKDFILSPKTDKLDEVIIQGSISKGQAKALNKQKSNEHITNVISSDQVGKFPDANIGDALKRVPGIAMQNDQGEARDIIVRGLAPQLNSVTLNGDRIPSAEGDNRRVQMDLIPSDMIQTIEVSKAVTPDMEADAIGGSVNLVTRTAPSTFKASLTASYGKNPVRKDGNNYTVSGIVANRTKDGKIGAVLNVSYNANSYGSDNVEFEWDKPDFIKEHDIRRYDVKRVRKGIGVNLDWKPDVNHTFEFKSIYNERDDQENRYRLRYKFKKGNYTVTRQTKGGINNDDNKNTRLERQTVYKFGVSGKHIALNNILINWKLSTSKAKEIRPNERYITYKNKISKSDVTQQLLNTKTPYFEAAKSSDISNFELDEISEEKRFTQEKKISSKIDIKIPLTTEGNYQNTLKLGYKYKYKEKERNNNYFDYTEQFEKQYEKMTSVATANQTIDGYLAGNQYKSGYFATKDFLGNLALKNGKAINDEFIPKNYHANEIIYAFYAMIKQNIGEHFSFIAGVRSENTDVDYQGFRLVTEKKKKDIIEKTFGNKSYINWLPNLQLKYKPNKNLIVRFAYTSTIARPNYYDLVPYENIVKKDSEIAYGNPNLKASQSTNLDLMGEYYFANVGIISLGGFYKNINNFIYSQQQKENVTVGTSVATEYDVTRIHNGGKANVYGIEFALQRKLNFLPGFLRHLTFYGNYTYTGSEATGIANREDGLTLAGAIENMCNTSLAFENKKFTLRGSFNYSGSYIDEYGSEAFKDRYYDDQMFVDVNASYTIIKGLRIFAEGKNLTNQPLRFYQGIKGQTMQLEYYGMNWNIGLKYNF